MRVYIAGPMSNIEAFNFPAFHAAKARWLKAGHEPISPADNAGGDTSKPYAYYIRLDIASILTCDSMAMLPGWENSRGAKLEHDIAEALRLPLFDAVTMQSL